MKEILQEVLKAEEEAEKIIRDANETVIKQRSTTETKANETIKKAKARAQEILQEQVQKARHEASEEKERVFEDITRQIGNFGFEQEEKIKGVIKEISSLILTPDLPR
jgi:vacuolar-type H+-ATPase subunit H